MKPFDLIACPLEGVNLIEASAGTGKTYALSGLFLRLLLEKKVTAGQILVITFTNAATAELKSRIRQMIVETRSAFLSGTTKNTFIERLLDKYPQPKERKSIIEQLNDALANYDETAIHTIHGFCQRALADNAFAGGLPFDAEFISDQNELENEFVEDFWRRHFYDNHPVMIKYAVDSGLTQDALLVLLQMALAHTDMDIIPDDTPFAWDEFERLLDERSESYHTLKKQWFEAKDTIAGLLQDKALNGQVYGKKTDRILREIEDILQYRDMPLPVPSGIVKLSSNNLKKKTNKNQKTPSHEIFDLCQVLCEQSDGIVVMMELYLKGLKKKFLESARVDFPGLKKQKNILYFDDLLNRAYEAVRESKGGQFAEILRKQYAAVLVDEFQDTDPIQYAILQSVFVNTADKNKHTIFYIGDPKQAIYSFRGADIHAYLRAEKSVDNSYTMTSNWRSEQSLINAVNTLFGKPSHAFVYDQIAFTPVERPAEQKTKLLRIEGDNPAGLHWWFVPAGEDEKYIGVMEARSRIIAAVIHEISGLLKAGMEGRALIGDERLSAGDIAILVRKNTEAVAFKNAMLDAGIPSVVYSSESVFTTHQADDLRRLMLGIIHYDHEGYLLSALSTPFFAYTADAISECLTESDQLENVRVRFKHLNDIWRQKGFLTMFYGLLEEQKIRVRIASLYDGERRLTNYVHLVQLLFQSQKEGHLQPLDLLLALEKMMIAEDNKLEEQQQKLETDSKCIKIVTVHRSKGLEYPIVFCPFAWEKGKNRDTRMPAFFHDEENNWQAVTDLGSSNYEVNLAKEEREVLAEDCRLLYVALTRAKNRCYFVSGNIRDAQSGAVHYLFHNRQGESDSDKPGNSELERDIHVIAREVPSDIIIKNLTGTEKITRFVGEKRDLKLKRPEFAGSIHSGWKIASYTYMAKAVQEEKEWDEDTHHHAVIEAEAKSLQDDNSILGFPPGAVSGSLLHEILEKVNFMRVDEERTQSIIKETLNKFGYAESWQLPVFDMLRELVDADLKKPDGGIFRLSQIGPLACQKEMAFYFPLRDVSARQIISLLEQQKRICGISKEIMEKRKIKIAQVHGFLKGFIDLVFEYEGRYYLADWKSNHFGQKSERYEPDNLQREIFGALYDLQYLIYTVALNQYLQKRIPDYSYDRHFGGVYYFFLRGISSKSETTGIYFDRPDRMLIEKMTEVMQARR